MPPSTPLDSLPAKCSDVCVDRRLGPVEPVRAVLTTVVVARSRGRATLPSGLVWVGTPSMALSIAQRRRARSSTDTMNCSRAAVVAWSVRLAARLAWRDFMLRRDARDLSTVLSSSDW